ncbi:MAG: bifunctional adenosylcobinamide kinase/adenosylcobinamide-phosphate guanylyltransferase, partial [Clostridia bacterium]|nr:bifunctional adenosylcobinamide kinase/adenosylcobinamide-phosphate guanylyltransferase [Clostridia bacterium]
VESMRKTNLEIYLVTNELGSGIVPENRLARLFRDIAGRVNQYLAQAADEVYLVVSGIPVKIKG